MTTLLFTKMYPDVKAPRLGTENSVGADIHAYLKTESGRPNKMMIPSRATRAIPTGLIIKHEILYEPVSAFGPGVVQAVGPMHSPFVCSRSGMAKQSLFVANSPGVIDPDYRGEILVLLFNGSHEAQYVEDGDRIAQVVLLPAPIPVIQEAHYDLRNDVTTRGEAGFGSTGR